MPTTTVTPECTREQQTIADAVARSKKIVVITGAGISTNAGIPDFRSQNGLYNLVKKKYPTNVVKGRDLFDSVLFNDSTSTEIFYTFMASLRDEVLRVKDSTPTHKFIRTLADSGRLLRCYTQNIDGLEERDGLITDLSCGRGKRKRPSPAGAMEDTRTREEKGCQVVQLHGELRHLRCTQCQTLTGYDQEAIKSLSDGVPPLCQACETQSTVRSAAGMRATAIGRLRPNVVLYGEEHPNANEVGRLNEADIRAVPDMMIILGTSLKVHGLKRMVREFAKAVHAKGGIVVFVNNTPPAESTWNLVIDYHVTMDCDAWVAEVKHRRPGIWERQTKLPVPRVIKAISKTVKTKMAALKDSKPKDSKNSEAKNSKNSKGKDTKAKEVKTAKTAVSKAKAAPKKFPVPRKRKSLAPTDANMSPVKPTKETVETSRFPTPPDSVGERTPTRRPTVVQMLVDQQLKEEIESSPSKRRRMMEEPPIPLTPMTRSRMIAVAV